MTPKKLYAQKSHNSISLQDTAQVHKVISENVLIRENLVKSALGIWASITIEVFK
jgi:hypothetical protein